MQTTRRPRCSKPTTLSGVPLCEPAGKWTIADVVMLYALGRVWTDKPTISRLPRRYERTGSRRALLLLQQSAGFVCFWTSRTSIIYVSRASWTRPGAGRVMVQAGTGATHPDAERPALCLPLRFGHVSLYPPQSAD